MLPKCRLRYILQYFKRENVQNLKLTTAIEKMKHNVIRVVGKGEKKEEEGGGTGSRCCCRLRLGRLERPLFKIDDDDALDNCAALVNG